MKFKEKKTNTSQGSRAQLSQTLITTMVTSNKTFFLPNINI